MEDGPERPGPGRAPWAWKPWQGLVIMGIADGTPRGSDKVRSGFSERLSLQGRKERAWREAGGEADRAWGEVPGSNQGWAAGMEGVRDRSDSVATCSEGGGGQNRRPVLGGWRVLAQGGEDGNGTGTREGGRGQVWVRGSGTPSPAVRMAVFPLLMTYSNPLPPRLCMRPYLDKGCAGLGGPTSMAGVFI